MRRIAILIGLAGCGRIGFTGPGGLEVGSDGGVIVPRDEIAVSVMQGIGPYEGAYVLVDRGTGEFERRTTDETGLAVFPASSATTFHVVYSSDYSWTIYTAVDVAGGTEVVFGNQPKRPGGSVSTVMQLTVPAFAGAHQYMVTGPSCVRRTFSTSTTQFFTFMGDCAGRAVHLYATVIGTALDTLAYMDLGDVLLVDHGTIAATGAWVQAPGYTLSVHGLPATATSVGIDLDALAADRDDFTSLEATLPQTAAVSGGAATWTRAYAPIANAVWMSASSADPSAHSVLVATPALAPGTTSVDASMMLPFLANLAITVPPEASWSAPDVGAADLVVFDGFFEGGLMVFVNWEVVGPPTMTHVAFPALPPDLVVFDPAQAVWDSASATLIDVGGIDRGPALRFAPGYQSSWLYNAQSVPPDGVAISQVYWQRPP